MSTTPTRPIIGIPAVHTNAAWGFWHEHAHLVADTYVEAVWTAGGLPFLIPPRGGDEHAVLERVLSAVDGLLLVGGADLDPAEYGQEPHELLEETSHVRDHYELPLIRAALDRDIPMLGVCRGLQAMNVATGGTLHQDLVEAGFSDHRPNPGHLDSTTCHGTRVEAGSLLAGIVAVDELRTNSHHHQGIDRIGAGAAVAARAVDDDCVEALEWPAQRFALGVQWHPERPRLAAFFSSLVQASAAAL